MNYGKKRHFPEESLETALRIIPDPMGSMKKAAAFLECSSPTAKAHVQEYELNKMKKELARLKESEMRATSSRGERYERKGLLNTDKVVS